jgi:hypothetical protein
MRISGGNRRKDVRLRSEVLKNGTFAIFRMDLGNGDRCTLLGGTGVSDNIPPLKRNLL